MKYLMALIIALLVPTAVMAKGECDEDKQKLCKEAIEAQGDVGACLDQHVAELSEACKTKREAKAKKPENETQTEPNQGATPKNDTSNVPSNDGTKQ